VKYDSYDFLTWQQLIKQCNKHDREYRYNAIKAQIQRARINGRISYREYNRAIAQLDYIMEGFILEQD
jgi:hypothetical protein